jgi:exosortase
MTTRANPWARASVALVVLLLYLPLFSTLIHLSASNPYAGHLIFVPIFAAVVLWIERHRFRGLTAGAGAAGLSLTALAVVVGWIAHGVANLPLYVVSFVTAIAGLLLSFFGRRGVREAAFPLGLLLLMVPPPQEAMIAIALEIQHFISAFSGVVLSAFGIPVVQDGIFLRLPGFTLIVAEECSGLRFLLILSVFAAALARTVLTAPSRQLVLVMLSIPTALLANAVRVAVTGAGAYAIGPEVVTGPLHYYIGKGFWAGALVATIGLALSLRSRTVIGVSPRRPRAGGCVASTP